MSIACIVAIPSETDYVWQISSEKIPHLTILNLGENPKNVQRITDFVEHTVDTSLHRFGMDVDHRGELGDNSADVLFFGDHNVKKLEKFRSYLLANEDINKAYNSTPQFPVWTPHLTMGFPETPAKPDKREFPGFSWVNFDRIAFWTGDSEGPEFRLKEQNFMDGSMLMSDLIGNELTHFGVKGMKWGSRRAAKAQQIRSTVSDDARKAGDSFVKLKKTGIHSLSNEELQSVVSRMNLETQYSKIAPQSRRTKLAKAGGKFAGDMVMNIGKQQANKFASDQAAKLIANVLKKK